MAAPSLARFTKTNGDHSWSIRRNRKSFLVTKVDSTDSTYDRPHRLLLLQPRRWKYTFKPLRIQLLDTTITLLLTDDIPRNHNRWGNLCLTSRRAQGETLRLVKRRRNTKLAKQCDTGNPKVSGCYLSERSGRSDSGSPKYESKANMLIWVKGPCCNTLLYTWKK